MVSRRISFYMDKDLADKAEKILEDESFDLKILCRAIITKTAKEGRSPLRLETLGQPVVPENTRETQPKPEQIQENLQQENEVFEENETKPHVKVQNNPFANLAK
ncbi:hypothetical protein QYM42_08240 [Lactococcus lactis]|uniref:hypothetical protein n=1 Tax=Lactococcus lactis TaxID=1358 RepID=UPI0026596A9F|nr:hypothetical protein [Lactococcus lactis]WKF72367.1 hypothetical protein QYM42_08240 [Lactococcus lactis]